MKVKKKIKTLAYTDPTRLASMFLDDYIWTADEEDPQPETSFYILRRWHETYFLWKDGRYIELADDTVKQIVTVYLQQYAADIRAAEQVILQVTRNFVANVLTNIQPKIHIGETKKFNSFLSGDDQGHYLCLKNRLLNLRTRELLPHTPNYFSTVCLPYEFDKDATCPDWLIFLDDVMEGHQEYITLLQEWCGYLFRPDLRAQKFLLCTGQGSNGKGVFFELIQALVGEENCSQVGLSRFNNPFALHETLGKVVNVTNESSHLIEDEAENILKTLVAGDRFTFERKFKDAVSFVPTAKIMIATNSLPRFNDKTQGIWRRLLLVPFDKVIPESAQIEQLATILREELSGILNWSLAGLDRLNAQGFTKPAGQAGLIEEYRRDADPARAFLLDNYEDSLNGEQIPCLEIYKTYCAYCDNNGCYALNERSFGKEVRRIFPQVERQRIGRGMDREYVYRRLVPCVP